MNQSPQFNPVNAQTSDTPAAVVTAKRMLDQWKSPDKIDTLKPVVAKAISMFEQADLPDQLNAIKHQDDPTGNQMNPHDGLIVKLSEQLCVLAIGDHCGLPIPQTIKPVIGLFVEVVACQPMWSNQWRHTNPPRRADLGTVEIGMRLAFATAMDPQLLKPYQATLRQAIWQHCYQPIQQEWLAPETRLYSLNGMGHNWWSVIVGSGGVCAALLGWEEQAHDIADALKHWFAFADAPLSRKHRNFGVNGDFIEGISYGQYALQSSMLLYTLRPDLLSLDMVLSPAQWQGLADFFSRTFFKTDQGYLPLQIGDVGKHYLPLTECWHTLWDKTKYVPLIQLSHAVKPKPLRAYDFLCWRDLPSDIKPADTRWENALANFDNAGMTFVTTPRTQLVMRAGEYWNHNHLDAGTFVYARDNVVWLDDSGCCFYGTPDYHQHYVHAKAHNIAYAPELCITQRRMVLEAGHQVGKRLDSTHQKHVSTITADTNILSGSALARSYRWLILLDSDVLLTWDDLGAYDATPFELLLHTRHDVHAGDDAQHVTLAHENKQCRIQTYCTTPVSFSDTPSPMDEQIAPFDKPDIAPLGHCLTWRSEPAERLYFGSTIGSTRDVTWQETQAPDSPGHMADIDTAEAHWTFWFNQNCNGQHTHIIPYGHWQGFETDAYMLAIRTEGDCQTLYAWQVSMLRKDGKVLHHNLARQSVCEIDLLSK